MNEYYKIDSPHENEYEKLMEIWEASVRATHLFLRNKDIEFYKSIIRENKIFEHVHINSIRNADNDILGFIGISENTVEMLFINPGLRGKGIGKTLLLFVLKDPKITKVDVNEQNENALKFYEHFGFKVVSRSELDGTGKPYPILHMELDKLGLI